MRIPGCFGKGLRSLHYHECTKEHEAVLMFLSVLSW
jgi:hypothetical protein